MGKIMTFLKQNLISLILFSVLLVLYLDLTKSYLNLKTIVRFLINEEAILNLTSKAFQRTPYDTLSIAIKDVKEKLNGIEISGIVLNQSCVRIEDQRLIFIYRKYPDSEIISSTEIVIKRINSGYAANFKVFMQNVPKDIEKIYIQAPERKISYYHQ